MNHLIHSLIFNNKNVWGVEMELLGECVALNLIISTVKVFLLLAKHQWEAEAGETQMLGQSE